MDIQTLNAVPRYDDSVNTTGCCPKFNPDGWDDQVLRFRDKPFLRATTRSAMHIPLNMGRVFDRVHKHAEAAGGWDYDNMIVLSRELSPWQAEHYFSIETEVPDEEMTTLSGDFITQVFEGPYRDLPEWEDALKKQVAERGDAPGRTFFFYTTCPKCAKAYGKNYVVGLAEIEPD